MMKLKIKMDCSYQNKKYKKGTEVTVDKRAGEVLTMFGYAAEIKSKKSADEPKEETPKEEPEKETPKKKSGDK